MSTHPIIHLEFPANDLQAAEKFYSNVFGWQFQTDEMYNYLMFRAEGGPAGAFVKTGEATEGGHIHYKPDSILVYIATDDIDTSLARIEEQGGKTLVPKTEIPHVGWFAVFTDPTGNRVALFTERGQQS